MAGRLSKFYNQWFDITTNPAVLEVVQGYSIPFISKAPSRVFCPEPVFSRTDTFWCDVEVERLRIKGAIVSVEPHEDQFLSSFFL